MRPLLFGRPLLLLLRSLLVTARATPASAIPARPALAPWCRLVSDRGRILVEHGETVVTFEGQGAGTLLPELLPLLDGKRTVSEVEDAMGRPVATAVGRALSLLAENNLLLEGSCPDTGDPATAAATHAAAVTRRITPSVAREVLVTSTVAVLGSGPTAPEIARQLEGTGVGRVVTLGLEEPHDDDSFVIAAPDRNEVGILGDLNDSLLRREQPWLQVLPHDGRHLVVGPIFLPGVSACRACYGLRRAACSGYEEDFELLESEPTRAPMPLVLTAVASGIACLLAIRWLAVRDPSLPGRFYAFETGPVLRLTHHLVLRVPRCRVCGPAAGRAVPLPWFREAS